jgi:phosphatidylinositol glycan class W
LLNYGVAAFLVDFLLNVIAILLAITLYSGASLLLSVLLFTPVCLLLLTPKTRLKRNPLPSKLQQEKHQYDEGERLNPLPIRPFVTMYRGCMLIVTCLAILAVDFKIFPRRFAKTENWGTSLMDMGVGSFVFSAGVVGARAILQERLAKKSVPLASRLSASAKHSLPLFVLGLVRLWSVKGLDYAEHITEYGVHWNFFFTLALLPPFVALFQTFFAMIPSYTVLALLLGSAYQASLEFTPLKAYILTAQRTDLLSKNREGIFSFIGYLAIYLAGQATGLYILPRNANSTSSPNNSNIATQERKRMVIRLASWSITWALLLYLTLSYKYGLALRISRRLANLPYVLWVCAFNNSQILAFCLIETFIFPDVHKATDNRAAESEASKATSRILKSYNRNGLAIFLVANLLTGFINMTIKTLDLSTAEATAILIGYALILTVFAFGLDAKGISIKF